MTDFDPHDHHEYVEKRDHEDTQSYARWNRHKIEKLEKDIAALAANFDRLSASFNRQIGVG